jgi:hypothetical protein
MSILQQATKAKVRPPMLTIIASKGVGKTTLAGLFPNPVFIRGEDGSEVFEEWDEDVQPTLLPPLMYEQSARMTVLSTIGELLKTEHNFKTLVIDAITSMNLLFEKELCKLDGVSNVGDASGGFHKGFLTIANWHMDIIRGCEKLRDDKNMAIVFLGHSAITKIKNSPDESSEYAVWGLDMHQKAANVYLNNSSGVYYLTKEKFITGAETNKKGQTTKFGRVTSSGNRVLITSGDGKTGYIDCKDRYGLDPEIPVEHGTNPLLTQIKFFNTQA